MIYIFELKWFILEQVPESSSPVEPEYAGVVSSSSTLHFATEAEEATAEESPVFLEEKKEEQAIASIVVLEAFNVAKNNNIRVEEPKSVCIFIDVCFMFQVLFFSMFNFYGFLVLKS